MRAENKSNEIWRTENSEIQRIGVGSEMKKRLENLKTLTWSLESPRQFSHFDVASITKHKIYYEEERGEERRILLPSLDLVSVEEKASNEEKEERKQKELPKEWCDQCLVWFFFLETEEEFNAWKLWT